MRKQNARFTSRGHSRSQADRWRRARSISFKSTLLETLIIVLAVLSPHRNYLLPFRFSIACYRYASYDHLFLPRYPCRQTRACVLKSTLIDQNILSAASAPQASLRGRYLRSLSGPWSQIEATSSLVRHLCFQSKKSLQNQTLVSTQWQSSTAT